MSLIIPANSLAGGGYSVDNSLRFNSGSSDYLNRTFGTSTNEKIWTFSTWFKANDGGSQQHIMYASGAGSDDNWFQLQYYNSSTIRLSGYNTAWLETSAKYRDRSSWYHVVLVANSTEATASNRLKLYVNGEQVSSFSTDNRSSIVLNQTWGINKNSVAHYIGSEGGGGGYLNGYLSESYFIDGQALTPTDFGEFDADSGIWKPIAYTGTYGTNGFFLEFLDSSALGDDTSGNSNDFTVNNLTSIDQTTDTPTNNFTLLNTLNYSSSTRTYGEGNTAITASGSGDWNTALNNIGVRSGKWYAEFKINSVGSFSAIGVTLWPVLSPVNPSATLNFTFLVGEDAGAYGWRNNGARPQGGSSLSSWGTNDILMIAMDMDNLKVYFGKNGTWETSGDPESGATGTGSIGDLTADQDYFFVICPRGGSTYCNFGNPAFTIASGNADANGYGNFEYAVPAGYLSLCTKNISEVNS
jgi:hypothetical protein